MRMISSSPKCLQKVAHVGHRQDAPAALHSLFAPAALHSLLPSSGSGRPRRGAVRMHPALPQSLLSRICRGHRRRAAVRKHPAGPHTLLTRGCHGRGRRCHATGPQSLLRRLSTSPPLILPSCGGQHPNQLKRCWVLRAATQPTTRTTTSTTVLHSLPLPDAST